MSHQIKVVETYDATVEYVNYFTLTAEQHAEFVTLTNDADRDDFLSRLEASETETDITHHESIGSDYIVDGVEV